MTKKHKNKENNKKVIRFKCLNCDIEFLDRNIKL